MYFSYFNYFNFLLFSVAEVLRHFPKCLFLSWLLTAFTKHLLALGRVDEMCDDAFLALYCASVDEFIVETGRLYDDSLFFFLLFFLYADLILCCCNACSGHISTQTT